MMQDKKKWIIIGASSALGLGLVSGGAVAAANAFEIRDAHGVVQSVDRTNTSVPGGSVPVSASSSTGSALSGSTPATAPATSSAVTASSPAPAPASAPAPEPAPAPAPASAVSAASAGSAVSAGSAD